MISTWTSNDELSLLLRGGEDRNIVLLQDSRRELRDEKMEEIWRLLEEIGKETSHGVFKGISAMFGNAVPSFWLT